MNDVNKSRSDKMKKNFKDGIIKGWAINKDKNRRSYPEKFFIKVFENNNLYNLYKIEEKFSYGKYFIDFLFVEQKLVLEIDGDQHFRNTETIEYDKERDLYFIERGFKVYRIRWKDVFHNPEKEINEFLEFLLNIEKNDNYRKYTIDDCEYIKKKKVKSDKKYKIIKRKKCKDCDKLILKENERCRDCYLEFKGINKILYREGKKICESCGCSIHGDKLCKKCYDLSQRKVNRPSLSDLVSDVEKIGYVKTGLKYGVSDNCIRKWIKSYKKMEGCLSGL